MTRRAALLTLLATLWLHCSGLPRADAQLTTAPPGATQKIVVTEPAAQPAEPPAAALPAAETEPQAAARMLWMPGLRPAAKPPVIAPPQQVGIPPEAPGPAETPGDTLELPITPPPNPARPGHEIIPGPVAPVEPSPSISLPAEPAPATDTRPVPRPASPAADVPAQKQELAPSDEAAKLREEFDPGAAGGDTTDEAEPAPEDRLDYGTFYHHVNTLFDLRSLVGESLAMQRAITPGWLRNPPPGMREAETALRQADKQRQQYEAAFNQGQAEAAEAAYQEARRLMTDALAFAQPSYGVEARALWLDRGTIVDAGSPDGLRAVIQRYAKAGFNVLLVETLNAGYPVYPSALLPQNPLTKGWDPLAVAVEEGHRLGMDVHAWVWCFAAGNIRHNRVIGTPDSDVGPILSKPELAGEALRNAWGGMVAPRQSEYWLSPASLKGRAFLIDVYKEVVTNYAVDGLQLDYIRYPFQHTASTMGYEAVGRQRFTQETGISIAADPGHMSSLARKAWAAWKAQQVNNFVADVSRSLRPIRPGLVLSAAVFPMARGSRILSIQQDWERWIENGWIDALSPMIYSPNADRYRDAVHYVANQAARYGRTLIMPGIGAHLLSPTAFIKRLDELRDTAMLGSTIFAAVHVDEGRQALLANGPQRDAAVVPFRRPDVAVVREAEAIAAYLNLNGPSDSAGLSALLNELEQLKQLAGTSTPTADAATVWQVYENFSQHMRGMLVSAIAATGTARSLFVPPSPSEFRARYVETRLGRMEQLLRYRFGPSPVRLAQEQPPADDPELTAEEQASLQAAEAKNKPTAEDAEAEPGAETQIPAPQATEARPAIPAAAPALKPAAPAAKAPAIQKK